MLNLCFNPLFYNFLRAILMYSWMVGWLEEAHIGYCWASQTAPTKTQNWHPATQSATVDDWEEEFMEIWDGSHPVWGMSGSKEEKLDCKGWGDCTTRRNQETQRIWMACFLTGPGPLWFTWMPVRMPCDRIPSDRAVISEYHLPLLWPAWVSSLPYDQLFHVTLP